jgi:hypothetical protein
MTSRPSSPPNPSCAISFFQPIPRNGSQSRRLTKEIKREFCLSFRTVALLAMFSKHPSNNGSRPCLHQQAWSISARMIGRILTRLTTAWTEDARSVNSDEWNSEHFKQNNHLYWRKVYIATNCKVSLSAFLDSIERLSEFLFISASRSTGNFPPRPISTSSPNCSRSSSFRLSPLSRPSS